MKKIRQLFQEYPATKVYGGVGVFIIILTLILLKIFDMEFQRFWDGLFHPSETAVVSMITDAPTSTPVNPLETEKPQHTVIIRQVVVVENIVVQKNEAYYEEKSDITFSPNIIYATSVDASITLPGKTTRSHKLKSGEVIEYSHNGREFVLTLTGLNYDEDTCVITIRERVSDSILLSPTIAPSSSPSQNEVPTPYSLELISSYLENDCYHIAVSYSANKDGKLTANTDLFDTNRPGIWYERDSHNVVAGDSGEFTFDLYDSIHGQNIKIYLEFYDRTLEVWSVLETIELKVP